MEKCNTSHGYTDSTDIMKLMSLELAQPRSWTLPRAQETENLDQKDQCSFDPTDLDVDIVVALPDAVSCAAFEVKMQLIGITLLDAVSTKEEAVQACRVASASSHDRPLLVILGENRWASAIEEAVNSSAFRKPCYVDATLTGAIQSAYARLLPSASNSEMRRVVQTCRTMWLQCRSAHG